MEVATWFAVWTFFRPASVAWKKKRSSSTSKRKKSTTPTGRTMVKHTVFGVERDIDIATNDFPTPQEIAELEEAFGADCQHGWFDSVYEGAKLHYRKKLPSNSSNKEQSPPIRAIVCWMHGIQAHGGNGDILQNGRKIEKALLAEEFNKNGFAFYAHDKYGHGYSEGTRRWIPNSYETCVQDFESLIRLAVAEHGGDDSDIPVFLGAESYGCTVAIHVARRFQDNPSTGPKNFKGCLLIAPAIIAELPPQPVFFILKSVLAPLFPKWAPFFMPNPVPPERIWKDPEVLALRTSPRAREMQIDASGCTFRLATASNMICAMEDARNIAIPGFTIPYCLIHGTHDDGVKIDGSEFMWKTAATPESDRAFRRVPDGYHDLFAEKEAQEHFDFAMAWMEKILAKP